MHFDIIRFGFLSFDSKCFGLVRFVAHKVGSIFMCRHVRKLFYCAVHLLSKIGYIFLNSHTTTMKTEVLIPVH